MQYSEVNKQEWFEYAIAQIEEFISETEMPEHSRTTLYNLITKLREKANE